MEAHMENVYTCSCGNQTWLVLEQAILCTKCNEKFPLQLMAVAEFNHLVLEEVKEAEEAL
jgi:hypothetical protein